MLPSIERGPLPKGIGNGDDGFHGDIMIRMEEEGNALSEPLSPFTVFLFSWPQYHSVWLHSQNKHQILFLHQDLLLFFFPLSMEAISALSVQLELIHWLEGVVTKQAAAEADPCFSYSDFFLILALCTTHVVFEFNFACCICLSHKGKGTPHGEGKREKILPQWPNVTYGRIKIFCVVQSLSRSIESIDLSFESFIAKYGINIKLENELVCRISSQE